MQYSLYGVTGRLITCSPFCYLSRSPISALANRKVTEVTGKPQGKKSALRDHAHGKNIFNSDIAVTSVTPVTYYLMSTENTDSTEVTVKISRSNFWRYPDFSLMHDTLGVFGKVLSNIWKTAISGVSCIVIAHKHNREGLQWTK